MSINNTPTITLTVGDPDLQINVECHQGPGGTQLDNTSILGVAASQAPAIATIRVHPTNPRAVIITVGTSPGTLALFVNESPGADRNLQVNIVVNPQPAVREIVFVSSGPVT